jgi:phospholipase A1
MYDVFFRFKIGLYFGYSQTMFWDLYSASNPFSEIDFNPDFFWRFTSKNNFLNDLDLLFIDFIQLGFYEHSSNGKDGDTSRAINRSYIQAQLSVGRFINFGINAKYNIYYIPADSGNNDYADFVGPFEGKVFLNINNESLPDRWQLYARFGIGKNAAGNWTFQDGWQEYGFLTSVLFSYIRLYAQVYYGYGESLLTYNIPVKNNATGWPLAIRAGVVLDLPQ